MQNAKPSASKNCRIVIGFLKKSDQNQTQQHRTLWAQRAPHRPMHHHPARLTCQREPARLPWWCSRSYGATPTAWKIFAPTAWVSIKRGGATFPDERYLARLARDPCAPRGRAILDLISGIDSHPSACISPAIFCLHSLNHGLPFV